MGKLDDICSKILNENILILLLLLVIFFKKFKIERLIRYECDLFVYLWLQRVYETLIEISTSSVTKPNYSPAFVSRPHGPNQMRGGDERNGIPYNSHFPRNKGVSFIHSSVDCSIVYSFFKF